MKPSNRHIGLALLVAAIAVGIVLSWWPKPFAQALQTGIVLRPALQIGEVALVDQHDRPFTRESLKGRWSVLFMGFTHCPDVCPTTLATLRMLQAQLGPRLQTVFVSVDPERDTPAALAAYLRQFSASFVGVTGDKAQLDELCRDLKTSYVKNPGLGGDYTVDHPAILFVVGLACACRGVFSSRRSMYNAWSRTSS